MASLLKSLGKVNSSTKFIWDSAGIDPLALRWSLRGLSYSNYLILQMRGKEPRSGNPREHRKTLSPPRKPAQVVMELAVWTFMGVVKK